MHAKIKYILATFAIILTISFLIIFFVQRNLNTKIIEKKISLPPEPAKMVVQVSSSKLARPFSPYITGNINSTEYPETNSWNLYHWSGNDYSFRYPKDWRLFIKDSSYVCWNCREEFVLSRGNSYPDDGWGEILIYVQYVGNSNDQSSFEAAQLSYLGGLKHEKVNGKIAAVYSEPKEKGLLNKDIPPSIKNYLFYQNGYVYRFALNDTKKTREQLATNTEVFSKVISTVLLTDPLSDWQIGQIPNIGTFRYPANWKIVSTPLEKMVYKNCSGPVIQDSNNTTTFIAFEIRNFDDKPKDYCWNSGDFSSHHGANPSDYSYSYLGNGVYKRGITTLSDSVLTDVILWKPTSDGHWNGDLFQSVQFKYQPTNQNVAVALINKNAQEKEANFVYDFLLATIRYN